MIREYASDIRVQRVKANIHVIICYKRRLWVMSWEKLQYLPSKADPYCFVSLVFNVLIEKKNNHEAINNLSLTVLSETHFRI